MALSPELLKRRKRKMIPRAPHKRLAEKVEGLKGADEELKVLLEELVDLADRETLFAMTLEKMRLLTALMYGGFLMMGYYNYEGTIGPLATVTTYLPVPPGFVYSPIVSDYYTSLPWFLTVSVWMDSDVPAPPTSFLTRAPDRYHFEFGGLGALRRFIRYTVTNLHAVNPAHYLAIQMWAIMRESVWEMLEKVYLEPIVVYTQKKAEELTGRPYP